MKYIYKILLNYKFKLALIYFYVIIVELLYLSEPYILGKTIDGLIKSNYYWLLVFLIIEFSAIIFMYKRMVYDTKIYTTIYNEIVLGYLKNDKTSDSSSKIARTDMAHSLIDFFENHVHYYIMSVISIVGSLYFIFLEHIKTGFLMLISILPILLIVKLFYKKISKATRIGNTHYEQKFSIMDSNDDLKINTFFKRRRKVIIHQSTLQGKNWTSLFSSKTLFLIGALIIFTNKNINLTQGEAIAMYSYINKFLISLLSIPVGMEMFARMKDIINRLKENK